MVDWTQLIITAIGPTGIAGGIAAIVMLRRRNGHGQVREERAAEAVAHPDSQLGVDFQAIDIAHQAMTRVKTTDAELADVRMRLSVMERSYKSLRAWSRRIISDWETLRHHADPPPLPDDLHDH